ncbi:hypothetical protein ACIPL1_09130 [Pseudomonas sp. NPDC090202]|uniref:hypothetical protein n=1 Tax=Pseudomonas sp. NPDC090202 TaxID=3364476 RepID=UPI00380B5656
MPTPFYIDDFPPYSLEATLKKSADALCLLFFQLENNFDFAEHIKNIRIDILNETLTSDLLTSQAKNCDIEHKKIAPYKTHFQHACIFLELASISVEKGDFEEAWSFVSQTNHLIGLTQAGLVNYNGVDQAEVLAMNARKGAEKKLQKQALDRDEVIRLIQTKRPPEGWIDEDHALRGIIPFFKEALSKNLKSSNGPRFELTPENCEQRISNWLKYNKTKQNKNERQNEVRCTFEEESRFRRSNPNNG